MQIAVLIVFKMYHYNSLGSTFSRASIDDRKHPSHYYTEMQLFCQSNNISMFECYF